MAAKKKAAAPAAEDPKVSETPAEPVSNDIDARMAALLKDHQKMGARPAEAKPE